jgi:hypothetical protein
MVGAMLQFSTQKSILSQTVGKNLQSSHEGSGSAAAEESSSSSAAASARNKTIVDDVSRNQKWKLILFIYVLYSDKDCGTVQYSILI